MESVVTEEELKAHLIATDNHFRQLVEHHHELDVQVTALEAKSLLSLEEQVEEARLKKLKLRVKDEIQAMLSKDESSAPPTMQPTPAAAA